MGGYTIQGVLASDVADGGTFTAAFPTGTNKGSFTGGVKNGLVMAGKNLTNLTQFIAVATTLFTITNRSGSTWTAGSSYVFFAHVPGVRDIRDGDGKVPINRACRLQMVLVNLGAPVTADDDGICAAQAIAGAANALLNGALAANSAVSLDVPRSLTMKSSNAGDTTQTVTVTGTDEYGVTVLERATLNGTNVVNFKKAFKTVSQVAVSAVMVGNLTLGTNDVLGLPHFLEKAAYAWKELEDGAAPAAGTFVAAVTSKATLTTGDVRGTYDPNSACDGAKCFQLWFASADPAYRGADQYGG